jgi:hypothetical protein
VKRLDVAMRSLEAAIENTARTLSMLTRAASRLAQQGTQTLYGVVGGIIGLAATYVFAHLWEISVPVAGTLLCSLGIVAGILLFRGAGRIEFDQRLEQNRIAADEVLRRIKNLPRNTPPAVFRQMWDTYARLNSVEFALPFGSDPQRQALPVAPLEIAERETASLQEKRSAASG